MMMHSLLYLLFFPLFSLCTFTSSLPYPSTNCYNENVGADLAKCAFGYGGGMPNFPVTGGKTPYVVTSNADSGSGTLRDALSQSGRFITFSKSMTIVLTSASLRPPSNTTIDGRGQSVVITGKSLRLPKVSNIIISNIAFINLNNYECKCSNCDVPKDIEYDDECADAINVQGSSRLWFVHCSFTNSHDGLLDMKDATHHVTVSHSKFYSHDKVMLIGSSDSATQDKAVRLTIAYNYFFGTGQRTPRIRFGVAHVYNNVYESWTGSALGASSSPTIISEGNFFIAGTNKEVADFKSAGIYVSRNDRLLNGAKAIPTAGLQNTTITDYQYVILDTDDQRRESIIRDAGVNVPTGVPTLTTPPITTSTPPATTPAATTTRPPTTPAAITPAATTQPPAATTRSPTTPAATTTTRPPTTSAATTRPPTTPAATTAAATTQAPTSHSTPAPTTSSPTPTPTPTPPNSGSTPVPTTPVPGTGIPIGISHAHTITPISFFNFILVISIMHMFLA